MSSLRMSVTVLGTLIGAMACAGDGPGTYFNPSDGNAVASAGVVANAVARRTVAFLGGSITEMNGYRPIVMRRLRERYPDVAFTEIAAGLSSTCSDTGAFRFARDVLTFGKPDLLIVEAAVNDDQDGHFDLRHCIRGLEGTVRRVLLENPKCRVVIGLMVNRHQYEQISAGEVPVPYMAARKVADRYGAAVADVGSALVDSARKGGMTWEKYGDCHPSPEGCAFGAEIVLSAIDRCSIPLFARVRGRWSSRSTRSRISTDMRLDLKRSNSEMGGVSLFRIGIESSGTSGRISFETRSWRTGRRMFARRFRSRGRRLPRS